MQCVLIAIGGEWGSEQKLKQSFEGNTSPMGLCKIIKFLRWLSSILLLLRQDRQKGSHGNTARPAEA